TAAEARKQQQADSEAQASRSWANAPVCIRLCMKAKERCKWPEVEMTASRARMSPRGGERKKQAKKAANNDNNEIIMLSGQKTKRQGGGHIQPHGCGQQPPREDSGHGVEQWAENAIALHADGRAGSGGSKEVIEDQEELKEPQGEELGGQEGDTEGVPGGAPEGEPEDVPGNELENGTGEKGQQSQAKGKGKEKAL
ncbi:hypothetical protein ID866_12833, partial [Astraeus odoratus]